MLAQAQSVSRGLLEQRRIFSSVQDKLVTVGERFPAISGLLNAIRRKKSKVGRASVSFLKYMLGGRCISVSAGWDWQKSNMKLVLYDML